MADGSHRLAIQQGIAAVEAAENAARQAQSPAGGDECGVLLSDASAAELAAIGLSPSAEIPGRGPLEIASDWMTERQGEAAP